VKFKKLKDCNIERSTRSFIGKYHPQECWIVNLSLEKEIKINKTKVKLFPFYKLFSEIERYF